MEIRALPVSERTPVIEPMEGVCWTGVFMSELTQPALEGMGAWPFKRYFLLLCQKDSVVMGGNVGLGDLRETPAGPFKPEIEGPFSWGTSRENYVLPYLSLSIEKAVGGAAPYPVVVSRDFQRTLLLQGKLLLSRVENGKATGEYTPVHVSFLFNMSSADFRVEQGVFCEECLL